MLLILFNTDSLTIHPIERVLDLIDRVLIVDYQDYVIHSIIISNPVIIETFTIYSYRNGRKALL